MPEASFRITPVRSVHDLEATVALFSAYAGSLGVDLAYQDFAGELASMPGKYAPPRGELLLARDGGGTPLGCVALRPIELDGCCEMKRLYVSPEGRGRGLGRALANAILQEAVRIGYREVRLDTLPTMIEAQLLYRKLGFAPIAPYYETPITGTVFMAKTLASASRPRSR
jgi:ribosomal protein S18 acetylase RimI-like enzyme